MSRVAQAFLLWGMVVAMPVQGLMIGAWASALGRAGEAEHDADHEAAHERAVGAHSDGDSDSGGSLLPHPSS